MRFRIYLATGETRREFLWVALGTDRSLYIGSAAAKKFAWGRYQTLEIPKVGRRINALGGRPMSQAEMSGKHSFHRSGFVERRSRAGAVQSFCVAALRDRSEPMPLISILPMAPTKYPVSSRSLGASNFLVNVSDFAEVPFGIFLFLKSQHQSNPPVVEQATWTDSRIFSKSLQSLELCVLLYTNRRAFLRFPEHEIALTSRPGPDGSLSWVFFADSPYPATE